MKKLKCKTGAPIKDIVLYNDNIKLVRYDSIEPSKFIDTKKSYDDIKLLFKADDNDDNFDLIDVIILLLMLFNDNMNIDNINGTDDDKNISTHILGFILYCLLIIRID
jgi:hypothetical protein